MADMTEIVNRSEFQQWVLQAETPVLVEFYLPRQRASRKVSAELDHLARELGDQAAFYRVDVNNADLLMADWKIRITPTVILFFKGESVKRWGNEQNEQEYRKALDRLVAALWQK